MCSFKCSNMLAFILSANPLWKTKDGRVVCFDRVPTFTGIQRRSSANLSERPLRKCQVGCQRSETEKVHKSNEQTRMRMWNQSGVESCGASAGCYALHGKERQGKQEGNTRRERTGDDGQDLTICMEVIKVTWISFSEVFCVVSFFFFTFLHTKKHQDGKHHQRWKERTKHSALLSPTQIQSKRSDFSSSSSFFVFFCEQLSLILTCGKATVQVLWVRSLEDQRGGPLSELCMSLPC